MQAWFIKQAFNYLFPMAVQWLFKKILTKDEKTKVDDGLLLVDEDIRNILNRNFKRLPEK